VAGGTTTDVLDQPARSSWDDDRPYNLERTDRVEPTSPRNLLDWVKLYPTLPMRTVALSLVEANNAKRCRDITGDRDVVATQLITARPEDFSAHRRRYEPDQPAPLTRAVTAARARYSPTRSRGG
jgi:hypothetical protein